MATAAAGFEDRSVSIGRIFSRAFGTLSSNPLATFGIALIFGALPAAIIGYGSERLQLQSVGFDVLGIWGIVAIALVTLVLGIVFWTITQGALVRATIAYSEGRKASIGESIAAGFVVALPLFLLALLSALGIGIGLVLLVVPGVILYIIWSVAAPALVEEKLGVLDALSRSSELTDGVRWKIFGLELVALVGYWMFSGLVGALAVMLLGGMRGMAANAAAAGGFPLAYYVLTAIANTATTAVWGVIQTSLYVELRNWKDGPPTDALAEVFG
ncbi:MAG: hypothetical protein JWO81_1383 [Alphaproteobacteria bacterium]|nr:hypothetical protein [Alphaproteobacteria bacterium]